MFYLCAPYYSYYYFSCGSLNQTFDCVYFYEIAIHYNYILSCYLSWLHCLRLAF